MDSEQIERINKNLPPKLTYKLAREYLGQVIRYGGNGVPMDKENIISALKIIMTEDLNVRFSQIQVKIANLNKLESNAFIECNRGDYIYRLKINKDFIESSTNLEFLYVLIHEFGHLKQYLEGKAGRKMRKSVGMRTPEIYTTTTWQQKGAHYRYYSNDNEHYADSFAFNKLLTWIREEQKSSHPKSRLLINKKKLQKDKFYINFDYALNKIKFIAWHGTNKILRIPESEYSYDFYETKDAGERMWDYISKNPLNCNQKILKIAKASIEFNLKSKNNNLKNLKAWQKQRILEKIEDSLRLVYAHEMGILPEEVGGCLELGVKKFQN